MKLLAIAALLALSLATSAYADSASHDWNSSEGFPSDNANANRFNAAQALWLLQNGHTGESYTTNNTNCETSTACQFGGTASNLNGVSVTTIESGTGITVSNDIDATSNQKALAVPVSASSVGQIKF
jgi:hypothetical protein